MSEKKLFLLDGHALVYRAHYAFITRPLINSKGINTSAITGFTRTLWEILEKQKPTHIAVAFDPEGPVFRNDMYEAYKANRDAQPEDISIALPYIRKIVEGFQIPIIEIPGFEADDAIGTIAKQAEAEGFTVYMVTPDKDYAQLVSDQVFMYKPSRQGNGVDILGKAEVLENWGITDVSQVVDILGLQGDAVDNIPGVPGIGPKTAAALIQQFSSLESILENVDQLKGKQKENLIEFAEQAKLSKKLAEINTNVPLQFDAKKYLVDPIDKDALTEIFKELEFRTLAETILGTGQVISSNPHGVQQSLFDVASIADKAPVLQSNIAAHSSATHDINNTSHDYILVTGADKLEALVKKLLEAKIYCFDTETTDVDPNNCELVGISFCIKASEAYFVPMPQNQDKTKELLECLRPVFESEEKTVVGQNIKFDALVLKWYGIELKGTYFDTMIAHYLLEPDLRHNMDYLAETYLKYKPISIESLIGKKGKSQGNMRDVEVETVKEYAAEDADVTFRLYEYFLPKLKEEGLLDLFTNIEAPLVKVLATMEFNGVKVEQSFLNTYSKELEEKMELMEKEIYVAAGTRFNIGSPKQVGELLFDLMKIPYKGAKTKTGQYSTDEEKLSELAIEYPIAQKILDYRGLAKLKSTYVDALPLMINKKSGRVHSSFNQALAATGRLSSNNPNLQNIPIKTPEGRKVRQAFVAADDDHTLLSADYSQVELRLIAEMSGEQAMLEAFQTGQDIHSATAAKIYGIPIEEVSSDQRRNAKTVNFSIIYGAGATNLSRQLNIKRQEAKELIDQYFMQYSGLKKYMEQVVEKAREVGYVETLLGRRRFLRDIHSRNSLARSAAERMAINTPIQGTAADLIKIAMIKIQEKIDSLGLKSKMILQVHDELVFEVYKPELESFRPIILEEMKNALPSLKVPLLVEAGTGSNWLLAH
jgi:DNA polymerase I